MARVRMERNAIGYMAPWVMWLAFLPLALVFSLMAMRSTPAAFFVAGAEVMGGAYLLWQVWGAYGQRDNAQLQIHAGVTTSLALGWLFCASAFGLFHKPDVDVWPEFWRIFEFALKSFTLPVWFAWFALAVITSATWNAFRAAKPKDEDGKEKEEGKETSELGKALDGAKIIDAEIAGDEDVPVIKAKIKGVPGRHVGADMMSVAGKVDSQHGLRPGATRIVQDPEKASDARVIVMPVDPHAKVKMWPGPSAPGAWIDEQPIPIGPHTDGETAAMWMTGDEETSRPNQHVAVAGMSNAGKSAAGKMIWADALTRRGFELLGADISGKIWQTFGPLIPHMTKIAGLNGTSDDDIANNVLDTKQLLEYVKRDAMERQHRWGKLGIGQWEHRCFEEFGDAFRLVVIEEAPDVLLEMGEDVVALARLIRSAGYKLWITAQRFDWNSVPTTLRSQLAAVLCFGVQDSRDQNMILPEDVKDVLSRGSVMNTPVGWQNNIPGKAIIAVGGMPADRRSDPVRTWYAKDPVIEEHLSEYAVRLWSVEEVEKMKEGIFPDGILVRTESGSVHEDGNVHSGRVRTRRPDVQKEEEFPVYTDPELENVHADPNEPVRMLDPEANDVLGPSEFDPDPDAKTSTEEFRARVQEHLKKLLAEGRTECTPKDVIEMQPPTGRGRQDIRKELYRLSEKAAADEVSTIPPDHPTKSAGKPGTYKLIAPRLVTTG